MNKTEFFLDAASNSRGVLEREREVLLTIKK
jgi:hypothetical protein